MSFPNPTASNDGVGTIFSVLQKGEQLVGKYWHPDPAKAADYSKMWTKWQTDMSLAPRDGTTIMGRLTGTNRARAVKWVNGQWIDPQGCINKICQWTTFKEYAETSACVWNARINGTCKP